MRTSEVPYPANGRSGAGSRLPGATAADNDACAHDERHAEHDERCVACESSPGSRPAIARLSCFGAQRSADAGIEFELAAEEPQQVRQPIEVGEDRRLHRLARLRQPHRRRARRAGTPCVPRRTPRPQCARPRRTSPTACRRSLRADAPPPSGVRPSRRRSAPAASTLSGGVASAGADLEELALDAVRRVRRSRGRRRSSARIPAWRSARRRCRRFRREATPWTRESRRRGRSARRHRGSWRCCPCRVLHDVGGRQTTATRGVLVGSR